jgi:hypothetical protein
VRAVFVPQPGTADAAIAAFYSQARRARQKRYTGQFPIEWSRLPPARTTCR